jgi:hypothetical protein
MKDYPTITISKWIPCGNIYCLFLEEDDSFHRLTIKGDMAKECLCGESWLNSIAKLLTYAMRRSIWEGNTKDGIIKQLLGQRCPSYVSNKEHILSCSDAIARCVLEYSKSRDLINEEEKTTTQEKAT